MDILIAGASGLLGSTVAPFLERRGHTIAAAGRPTSLDVPRDLLPSGAIGRALDSTRPQAVLNLSAKADVDACERDPAAAEALNADLPARLAEACDRRGIPMIHVSTDMVYDGPGPHREDDVRPVNAYASSKLRGDLRASRSGACVLRTNFFGPSRHPVRRSFSDWLLAGFAEGRELTLLRDVLFTPLHMETLAAMIEISLGRTPAGEILNLGSRSGLSKRDFALRVAAVRGFDQVRERPVLLSDLGLAAARPLDMRMDVSRFEAIHGTVLPELEDEIHRLAIPETP